MKTPFDIVGETCCVFGFSAREDAYILMCKNDTDSSPFEKLFEPQYVERCFKREHLQQIVHGVGMVGIKDQTGTLINRDDYGRCKITNGLGLVTAAPVNVILPPKTSVIIMGWEEREEYNNRLGTIVQVVRDANSYIVDVGDELVIVKWENVRA